eukprot:gene64-biopygen21040
MRLRREVRARHHGPAAGADAALARRVRVQPHRDVVLLPLPRPAGGLRRVALLFLVGGRKRARVGRGLDAPVRYNSKKRTGRGPGVNRAGERRYRLQFCMSGAGVAQAWRGHGAGIPCPPWPWGKQDMPAHARDTPKLKMACSPRHTRAIVLLPLALQLTLAHELRQRGRRHEIHRAPVPRRLWEKRRRPRPARVRFRFGQMRMSCTLGLGSKGIPTYGPLSKGIPTYGPLSKGIPTLHVPPCIAV